MTRNVRLTGGEPVQFVRSLPRCWKACLSRVQCRGFDFVTSHQAWPGDARCYLHAQQSICNRYEHQPGVDNYRFHVCGEMSKHGFGVLQRVVTVTVFCQKFTRIYCHVPRRSRTSCSIPSCCFVVYCVCLFQKILQLLFIYFIYFSLFIYSIYNAIIHSHLHIHMHQFACNFTSPLPPPLPPHVTLSLPSNFPLPPPPCFNFSGDWPFSYVAPPLTRVLRQVRHIYVIRNIY